MLDILVCVILTEALTEVLVKSVIFKPLRDFVTARSEFFGILITCGYCTSFWFSAFISIFWLALTSSLPVSVTQTFIANLFISILVIQRLSNMLHGAVDRYFATAKDIRYIKIQGN